MKQLTNYAWRAIRFEALGSNRVGAALLIITVVYIGGQIARGIWLK